MIGIFDSGFGGLSIFRRIKKVFPRVIYFGDSINAPYGDKDREAILKNTEAAISFLRSKGATYIVIACNTASAYFFDRCDSTTFEIITPTVRGIIDSGYKDITILSTEATKRSGIYERELLKRDSSIKVSSVSSPELASAIERGEDPYEIIKRYRRKIRTKALLLGCTHYILKKELFSKVLKGVSLIDPLDFIVKWLKERIDGSLEKVVQHIFYTSKDPKTFKRIGEGFLEERIQTVLKK